MTADSKSVRERGRKSKKKLKRLQNHPETEKRRQRTSNV